MVPLSPSAKPAYPSKALVSVGARNKAMADEITTAADQRHEALRARRGGGRGHAAQRLGAIGIGPGGAAGTEAGAGAGRLGAEGACGIGSRRHSGGTGSCGSGRHRLFGAEVPCIRPAIPTALSSGRIAAAGLTQPSFELRHAGFGRFAGRGFARDDRVRLALFDGLLV